MVVRAIGFDSLARHYDWMEMALAGRLLQRARLWWLPHLADRRHVLSIGEGHGKFAAAFARQFPGKRLTCVDSSSRMLDRARRRLRGVHDGRSAVTWVHASAPEWQSADGAFDAVVTHFFLDCFPANELSVVVDRLAGTLQPGTVWLITDFAVPPAGLRRWRAQAIHRMMYGFFRRVTGIAADRVVEPGACLRGRGFTLKGRREFEWGLVRADMWVRRQV